MYFFNLISGILGLGFLLYIYQKYQKSILFLIFDKLTNCYTLGRISYRYFCKIISFSDISQTNNSSQHIIQKILLIQNNSIIDYSQIKNQLQNLNWKYLLSDNIHDHDLKDLRLEIHYTINQESYIVVFPYANPIKFPIYDTEILQNNYFDVDWEDLETNLKLTTDEKDTIYQILKKYGGPLGNFYLDQNFKPNLKGKWLINHETINLEMILRNGSPKNGSPKNGSLSRNDSFSKSLLSNPEDYFKLIDIFGQYIIFISNEDEIKYLE